ncbi:ABC transporter permease subunit [Caenimonas koreensis DSM 17982]|uniref:ABC transporter permease subunit n=1 Tax=Caenimonas koreensis DSM 17982 TaxID=1121255 RepID=A0A844B9E4_9BURK|nr:amino acid ABC transporter permease [Caenimonas koreensis]MRD48116.1 ABC transporter permease subunit [Caenimonas koreensis DSM 17982]
MLIDVWPASWSRLARSNATLAAGALLLIAFLWALGSLLALAPEPIGSNAQQFAEGARTTLGLTLVAGSIGLVLGLAAALGRTSRAWALRRIASFYIWLIRGTPLLVQILFVYFALPVLVPGLTLPDFAAAVVALSLNVGAYNAEVIRGALLAVPQGQRDAARALGLKPPQVLFGVVLPQAFRVALPALAGNVVALLKDSSLAFAIGVVELTNVGNRVQAVTFQPVATLATTACIYLILTTLLTQFSAALEHRMDRAL